MIPIDDETCLTLLKEAVFIRLIGEDPHLVDDLLALRMLRFDFIPLLHLAVGLQVV